MCVCVCVCVCIYYSVAMNSAIVVNTWVLELYKVIEENGKFMYVV